MAIAETGELLTDTVLRATVSLFDRGAAGLVVRYRDPDNHYRFSFDVERGERLLVRRRGGHTEALWSDRFEAQRQVAYDVVVRAIADQLTVFWNGVPLCHVEDDTQTTGYVGLYSRNRGATFSDVWAHAAPASPKPPRLELDGVLDGGGDDHRITVQVDGPQTGSAGVLVRRAGPRRSTPSPSITTDSASSCAATSTVTSPCCGRMIVRA